MMFFVCPLTALIWESKALCGLYGELVTAVVVCWPPGAGVSDRE